MAVKHDNMKFSVRFSPLKPDNVQVATLLNQQSWRGKAQYIVDAVLHYETCSGSTIMTSPPPAPGISISTIEAIIKRLLSEQENSGTFTGIDLNQQKENDIRVSLSSNNFTAALEIGKDGEITDLDAVVDALMSFRKRPNG